MFVSPTSRGCFRTRYLNQCRNFFESNPRIERIPFYDTAGSVKMVTAEKLDDAGAIASATAAGIYGARILRKSIEDDRANFTRFFLLRKPRSGTKPLRGPARNTKRLWCSRSATFRGLCSDA